MTVGSRNVLGALRQLAFVWLSASLRLGVVGGFVHAGEFKMNVRKVIDQIWREGGAAFATDPQLIRNWTFRPGQGRLVISNATGDAVPEGQLRFGGGITASKLWFEQSGADLLVDVLGTADQVRISKRLTSG